MKIILSSLLCVAILGLGGCGSDDEENLVQV